MFEKYNEKARRALFFARYEASKLGSRVIESEHVLGLIQFSEETDPDYRHASLDIYLDTPRPDSSRLG